MRVAGYGLLRKKISRKVAKAQRKNYKPRTTRKSIGLWVFTTEIKSNEPQTHTDTHRQIKVSRRDRREETGYGLRVAGYELRVGLRKKYISRQMQRRKEKKKMMRVTSCGLRIFYIHNLI